MQTDTQQALKDRIVAALVMNGWGTVFELWWRSYNRGGKADQELADHSVGAYLDRMADDIAEALITWAGECEEFGCHDPGHSSRSVRGVERTEGSTDVR